MGPDGHIVPVPGAFRPRRRFRRRTGDGRVRRHRFTKPPAERISLSLAAVNHTRNMWLAAWGAEKAPAIAAGVAGTAISEIPAAGARGQMETLWLTDLAGSANL